MIESEIPDLFLTELNKLAGQHNVPLKVVKKFYLREINRYASFSFINGWVALNWVTNLLNEYKQKKEIKT